MGDRARYDAVADWYEREFTTGPLAGEPREPALRLLGPPAGSLLDVACGGGAHTAAFAEAGWDVTGVDESAAQLRYATRRDVRVVQADAASLPFADASFDAAVCLWLHTDANDFSPTGLRAKVGAVHLPLQDFMHAFVDAGFHLEHLEEPTGGREYPHQVALRWRR